MALYVHPVVAAVCLLCAIHALYLGIRGRRRSGGSGTKKHESFGSLSLGGFILACGIGLGYTFQNWQSLMLFRDHFYAGMAVLPFAIIGLISGHILSARTRDLYACGRGSGMPRRIYGLCRPGSGPRLAVLFPMHSFVLWRRQGTFFLWADQESILTLRKAAIPTWHEWCKITVVAGIICRIS